MQKFIVLYMAPPEALEAWAKTEPAKRKADEEKMQKDWQTWMQAHAALFTDKTAGTGKTKRVDSKGISDSKNAIMLFSLIEAESSEAAANTFKDHPHFGIPDAWIEIMPVNYLPGMKDLP